MCDAAARADGSRASPSRAGFQAFLPPGARAAAGRLAGAGLLVLPVLLSGCSQLELMNPKGAVGEQEKGLILVALFLMLLVVVPVIVLTLYFGWRYRETNTQATYAPKWSHSTPIEIVVWSIPCVIVAVLAVLIWKTTHELDPYKPIASQTKPVRVDVIALNWKWLFIYPDYGVASVNRLQIPVDTPVEFRLTAESLMNSFFIPQLGSMVYAMAGMQTRLHLVANHTGTYHGLSAAYSGEGFSDMRFDAIASSRAEFDAWVAQARRSPLKLDPASYRELEQPSTRHPVTVYANATPALFEGVVNRFMRGPSGEDICRNDVRDTPFARVIAQRNGNQAAEEQ
nr:MULTISPECIES: ubiquinol oxidase subunit II [Cupriavidus]